MSFGSDLMKEVGYEWFLQNAGIRPLTWKSTSYLVRSAYDAKRLSSNEDDRNKYFYNKRMWESYAALSAVDHLAFSLKNEPLDLFVIAKALNSFGTKEQKELEQRLKETPNSEVLRRMGYLYEKLTGRALNVSNTAAKVPYSELIDSSLYYTLERKNISNNSLCIRWHVKDNALGELGVFSPVIKRDKGHQLSFNVFNEYKKYIEKVPDVIRGKIVNHLYEADSIANFEIEGEQLSHEDEIFTHFVKALKSLSSGDFKFTEQNLSALQRIYVEKDKSAQEYRFFQNAIGGKFGAPSYICPPPQEVKRMMSAIGEIHSHVTELPPVVGCAAVSGSFVLVHPFLDGNGRLSRLLISDILFRNSEKGTPIIPVCLGIEARRSEYISTLAALTAPIMKRTLYTVENSFYKLTKCDIDMYRYPDLTEYTNFLQSVITETIDTQIPKEVETVKQREYLTSVFSSPVFSQTINARNRTNIINAIVDNNGKLSSKKRKMLIKRRICTQEQIKQIDAVLDRYYGRETAATNELTRQQNESQEQEDNGEIER